ncbi:hotdog fold domain-containing protein [Rhodococcus sp. NPDC058521]|uniref:hotdog fold domain-containing protein n=1 Tax=Rhodococcus sp. NPDC058521 TaxID=3346536 RepID=UPI00365993D9
MNAEQPVPKTLELWRKLSGNPVGRLAFSVGLWARAPYFATVLPTVQSAEPGKAVVAAPKWFGVHNHIGTFHAIAACNLAETAMGMVMEASTPHTHQWIPKGMDVQYLGKAVSSLRAVATLDLDIASIIAGRDVPVDIAIYDTDGKEVVHAQIVTWVRPKQDVHSGSTRG